MTSLEKKVVRAERYYVQSEHVRGEPRMYWVCNLDHEQISTATTNRKRAERECEALSALARLKKGRKK